MLPACPRDGEYNARWPVAQYGRGVYLWQIMASSINLESGLPAQIDPVSTTPPPPLKGRIEVDDKVNQLWQDSEAGHRIGVTPDPLIKPGSSVFTIGSCFAQNIRFALNDSGHRARPEYESLDIDRSRQQAGPLRHINYYDTFSIKQEFERVLSEPTDPYYVPVTPGRWPITPGQWGHTDEDYEPWDARYQDPRRHGVIASSEEGIIDVMSKVDTLMREAIETAEVFIITLGLIESWVDTQTGSHVWSSKVRAVSPTRNRFQFHQSDYGENYANLAWVCDTIADRFPGRPIVITVSPVGLLRTFTDNDVVVANNYSKSVLRAVAGAIDAAYDHVTYWPSYELALVSDVFKEDGRHVERHAVDHIVDRFIAAHATLS